MTRKPCTCIADFNAKLDGQELETSLVITPDLSSMGLRTFTPLVRKETGKRENRRSKPGLAAHAFCPFCGASYDAPERPVCQANYDRLGLDDPEGRN